jgi:hypothetical protein
MPVSAQPSSLRKVLEEQFSVLAGELAALHEQELASRQAEQREALRGELAESLNQAVRRLRQAENFQQISAVLADSSTTFAKLLAVFSIDGDVVRAERVRGRPGEAAGKFSTLEFPVTEAAAFAGAVETGDPVVTMTAPREISAAVAETFAHKPDDRAYVLPLAVRGKVAGLVYASGAVEMAPLELLAQSAALVLETRIRAAESSPKPELIAIQGAAAPVPKRSIPGSWMELSAEDQELHLRAQRFARVQASGMRLFSPELVRQGRASKDLYGALQKEIDPGREIFRQMFLTATATMVDYFHLELLRTLANDDASLLGEKYPGPLV